jgi:hypothetical protein
VTYLYRIVALANGTQSFPSSTDFATTATSLFAEPIVGGVMPIRASHVRELRLAIDAVRASTGLLPACTTAFIAEGWPADYGPPTGLAIRANDVGAMRRALDDAMSLLNGSHIVRTNPSGITLANDFNQLREGVRADELGVDLDEILGSPDRLVGMTQEELRELTFRLQQNEWPIGTLAGGAHTGEGLVLRETDAAGNLTGTLIRFHPGGGHHGPFPYWLVSSPGQGTIRAFYARGAGGNW